MKAEVIKTFHFEAAHTLPHAPEGHKCRRMHGHSYRLDVHAAGPVEERSGWVIDFGEIARAVEPVLAELDHCLLNEVSGLENPTTERIAQYLFHRIAPLLPGLSAVTVWESETARGLSRRLTARHRNGQVPPFAARTGTPMASLLRRLVKAVHPEGIPGPCGGSTTPSPEATSFNVITNWSRKTS